MSPSENRRRQTPSEIRHPQAPRRATPVSLHAAQAAARELGGVPAAGIQVPARVVAGTAVALAAGRQVVEDIVAAADTAAADMAAAAAANMGAEPAAHIAADIAAGQHPEPATDASAGAVEEAASIEAAEPAGHTEVEVAAPRAAGGRKTDTLF